MTFNQKIIFNEAKDYVGITLGVCLYAFAFTLFLLPYQIVTGGVTGLSAVIYYATGFPIQNTYLIINVALLIVGLKVLGFKFLMKTIYAILLLYVALWFAQDIMPVDAAGHYIKIVGEGQDFMSLLIGCTLTGSIYSDLTYDYTDDTSPGSAFAADLALYYQSYPVINEHECQLGLGMNISNIGSKITFGGSDNSEFIPTNLRIGASLKYPIDNYNSIAFAADANKLLVPTYPKQKDGESTEDYQQRVQKDYYDVSSISGIFKSFSDAPGGFKEELEEIQWSVGAEYNYSDRFSIRAGYHHESQNKGNRKYFTVGAGFKMSAFQLDAGYVIGTAKSNPLDQTLRFSLTFDMDGIKDLFNRR